MWQRDGQTDRQREWPLATAPFNNALQKFWLKHTHHQEARGLGHEGPWWGHWSAQGAPTDRWVSPLVSELSPGHSHPEASAGADLNLYCTDTNPLTTAPSLPIFCRCTCTSSGAAEARCLIVSITSDVLIVFVTYSLPNYALEALRNALYKCSTYLLTYKYTGSHSKLKTKCNDFSKIKTAFTVFKNHQSNK